MTEDFNIHEERISSSEKEFEKALRPLQFEDFSGQKSVVENLQVFVEAAKFRGEPLDHTLLHGPPGLGKTTLPSLELSSRLEAGGCALQASPGRLGSLEQPQRRGTSP